MRTAAIAAVLVTAACRAATATQAPAPQRAGTDSTAHPSANAPLGATSTPNADPFPSTYKPLPAKATVIRNVNILTAGLSILAITLTQMVLNRQNQREMEDRRRDMAMHAKLDALIAASKQARNEFVDLEEKEEEEIVQLKEEVKETIEELPDAGDEEDREDAKRVVEKAAQELKKQTRKKRNGKTRRKKAAAGKR